MSGENTIEPIADAQFEPAESVTQTAEVVLAVAADGSLSIPPEPVPYVPEVAPPPPNPMSPEHVEMMLRAAFIAGTVQQLRKSSDQEPLYYHERDYARRAMADAMGLT